MENTVSLSIVDIMGNLDNGLGILYSLRIKDTVYEMVYWFDNDGGYRLVTGSDFLTDFNLNSVYEYKKLPQLIKYLDDQIPNKEMLMKQYGIIGSN